MKTKYGLAGLLEDTEELEAARRLFEEVVAGQTEQLGPSHTDTLRTKYKLAGLFEDTEEPEAARRLFEECVAGYTELFGSRHATTLNAKHQLLDLLEDRDEVDEVRKIYQELTTSLEMGLPADMAAWATWVVQTNRERENSSTICLFGANTLPNAGTYYVEATFNNFDSSEHSIANQGFVGLADHSTYEESNYLSKMKGAWGFRDDKDKDALRVDGKGKGRIRPLNEHGRSFGAGDHVGLMIDMDQKIMKFYRNGTMIKGAVVQGFNGQLRLAACVPDSRWTVSLSFPGDVQGPPS
jgi:hypothetical protein